MNAHNALKAALSLSVAAVALNAGAAHASNTFIFGGGSTLAYELYDTAGQCVGVQNPTETSSASYYDVGNAQTVAGCTTPINGAYEYLFTGAGSGQALQAFTNNNPAAQTSSKYNATDSTNGVSSLPYPSFQLAFSDAPLDTPDTVDFPFSATVTPANFTQTYTTNVTAKRGAAWEIPTTATSVALGYDLPSATFGSGFYGTTAATATVYNGTATAPINSTVVNQLDLSVDMVCYIWTGYDSKGALISGTSTNGATSTTPPTSAGSWSDAIFYGTKSTAKTPKPTSFDSNLVQSSVAGLPIKPYHRSDASGTTYLFTLWLKNNCKGYAAAGYSTPAVQVTWPSWISSYIASGTGAMGTTLATTAGAIGYISTDTIVPAVTPASGKGPVAAFLVIPKTKAAKATQASFLYPNPVNTAAAESGVSLPTSLTLTKWGTILNKKFFKNAAKTSGYPITGLTYVMGYSCYNNATSDNTLAGVEALLNYFTTPGYQTIAKTFGFAPLTQAQYTSAVSLIETAPKKNTIGGLTAGASSTKICPAFASSTNN
jgi:ABC-type phosphate transport system substrate-binding protein